jgi:hypothetical protein
VRKYLRKLVFVFAEEVKAKHYLLDASVREYGHDDVVVAVDVMTNLDQSLRDRDK